jgi:hypothetical protein
MSLKADNQMPTSATASGEIPAMWRFADAIAGASGASVPDARGH